MSHQSRMEKLEGLNIPGYLSIERVLNLFLIKAFYHQVCIVIKNNNHIKYL